MDADKATLAPRSLILHRTDFADDTPSSPS